MDNLDVFFLPQYTHFNYNADMIVRGDQANSSNWGGAMRQFYFQVWIPFTLSKRRILVLSIASYIALC